MNLDFSKKNFFNSQILHTHIYTFGYNYFEEFRLCVFFSFIRTKEIKENSIFLIGHGVDEFLDFAILFIIKQHTERERESLIYSE